MAGCFVAITGPAFAQSVATFQKAADAWAVAYNQGDAKAIAEMYTADAGSAAKRFQAAAQA